MFFKIGGLKSFTKFTGKHVLDSNLSIVAGLICFNFIKKRPQHRYFPVQFAKFFWNTFS